MKKHYDRLCITSLGFVPQGSILQASIVDEDSMVTTTGQKTESYDFSDADTFNIEWE